MGHVTVDDIQPGFTDSYVEEVENPETVKNPERYFSQNGPRRNIIERQTTAEQQIRTNKQQIRTNEQRIRPNEQRIRTNKQQIKTNKQQIKTNEQQIKTNEQPKKKNITIWIVVSVTVILI